MTKKPVKKTELEVRKKETKDRAIKFFAKGKWDKALEEYLQLWKLAPSDFRVQLKIADILMKLDRHREATAVYKKVASAYAKEGFLIQAISVCKIVLELVSEDLEIKNLLSSLYSKRGMDRESKIASGHPLPPTFAPPAPVAASKPKTEPTLLASTPPPPAEIPAKSAKAPGQPVLVDNMSEEFFEEDSAAPAHEMPTIPLFSDLQPEEFLALVDSLTPWKIPEGTVVIQEGAPGESMFIIAHGKIKVQTQDAHGQVVHLAQLGPGDFIGEIGLFSRSPRTASCIAEEETELLEVKRSDFDQIIERFPRVREVLNEFYSSRILDTILAKSELFGCLKADVRKELTKRFQTVEFGDAQDIIQEGDEGDALFMIRDGQVEVLSQKDSHLVELALLKAGEFFGEVALITGQKRTASVRAKGPCSCIRLSRDDFNWAIQQSPEVLDVVKAYVDKRVQDTINTMIKES